MVESYGDDTVGPAQEQLKQLADALNSDNARLLIKIGRDLLRRQKAGIPVETLSPRLAAEVRRRLADPDDKPIPFDQACRDFGI